MLPAPVQAPPAIGAALHHVTHHFIRLLFAADEGPPAVLALLLLPLRPARLHRQRGPAPLARAEPPNLLLQLLHPRHQRFNDRDELFPGCRRKILHIGLFPRFREIFS